MAKKILIIDDAPIIRRMLTDIILAQGYEVAGEAVDGVDGVQKFLELRPDLVTLDIIMPKQDGLATLKEILAHDANAKVIMISAIDQKEYLSQAIALGVSDYIVKPFDDGKVIASIKTALEC
ncbi:MAG: response regulator [Oligoflexia bacterium]|nr:response regulator [Oligoflexia bacterium]